ncbi:hypothetical protein MPSEU_000601000 [Mayamaea pseudoterrestris]|nr:hypothetical protein MPSEU_000601000 [Mayamaea pseudoterrestris]
MLSGVAAFAPTFGVPSSRTRSALSAASTMKEVRKSIGKLSKDNMSSTLSEIEPFLLNNAGPSFYSKSMGRITAKAKALGAEVPAGYAKAAKATEKRREKQDAFVKAKIAEADEAAAAAAAEAAEAAAAPADDVVTAE